MTEVLSIRIQEFGNCMSIHAHSKCAYVQFIQFGDSLQEVFSTRPKFCVIPEEVVPMPQLEMVYILWK
jgi:hypothetical protein